jgi:hypothetical protein
VGGALAVLGVTVAAPMSASAEPGAPTQAPPAAKRVCVKYRVVQTPSGPAARCVVHRTEVLGPGTSAGARPGAGVPGAGTVGEGGASQASGGGGAPSSESTGSGGQAQPGDHQGSGTAAKAATGGQGSQPPSSADRESLSDGGGWGVVAIVAACALAAALLLALMRRPLLRWFGALRAQPRR